MDKASFDDVLARAARRSWRAAKGSGPVLSIRYPQHLEPEEHGAVFEALERVEFVSRMLDVSLRLTGGGFGCVDFEFSTEGASPSQVDALVESETFKAALDATGATQFSISRTTEPKTWTKLSSQNVYIFTNRSRDGDGFGAEPADHLSGRIYEVECAAEQGKAAAGRPIWKRLAPALFRGGKPQPKVTSLRELSAEETAAAAAAGGRPVLLHVHGVATSFRDAVIDTAELAMNLEVGKLGLTPCLFTWPSDGPVTGYDGHTRKAERSEKPLADLLAILRTQTEHVDVVAHSHGNKLLLRAAGRFRTDDKVIHEALLVAPDVDHGVMQDLLPDLARIAEHSTLYFCSHDVALKLSEGKFGAPRAGSVGIDAGHLNVDCVNVDSIVRGPVAHSYHANTQLVVADMHYTLSGLSPDRRYGLTASGKPRVFVYEPLKKAA